jgi:hypothetical protein
MLLNITDGLDEYRTINKEVKYLSSYMDGLRAYLAYCRNGYEDISIEDLQLIREEIDRTAAYIFNLKKRLLEIDFEKIVGQ